MKNIKTILIAVFVVATLFANAQNSKNDFFGMWTFDIEDGSVGWLVDDFVVAAFAFVGADVPSLRGGAFEHGSCGGARGAHRLVEAADAARAVGVLGTEAGVADGLLDCYAVPVGA